MRPRPWPPTDFMEVKPARLRKLFKGKAWNLGDDIINRRLEVGRRYLGDVICQLIKVIAHGQLGRDLAMGKPVALDAKAEERETRGFISITTWRPVFGSTAN